MAKHFDKSIFWDIEYDQLDYQKNSRFVVQRVFERGTLDHISELYALYGEARVQKELAGIDTFHTYIRNFVKLFEE
jgi:hypothetical protein